MRCSYLMNEAGIEEVKKNNVEANVANTILGVAELLGFINMDISYLDAVEKARQRTRNCAKITTNMVENIF